MGEGRGARGDAWEELKGSRSDPELVCKMEWGECPRREDSSMARQSSRSSYQRAEGRRDAVRAHRPESTSRRDPSPPRGASARARSRRSLQTLRVVSSGYALTGYES